MHRLNTGILFMKNSNDLSKLGRDYFQLLKTLGAQLGRSEEASGIPRTGCDFWMPNK